MPLRSRPVTSIALAIAAIVALDACHRGPSVPDGDITATLTLPSIDAHVFDPATLKGKPSIVLFVTPTCSHCLATIPRAAAAAKAADANIVAVFVAGKAANAAGVVETTKFWGPALIDDGTLRKRYDITGVPFILVLGADGHAREAYRGEQEQQTFVTALASAR